LKNRFQSLFPDINHIIIIGKISIFSRHGGNNMDNPGRLLFFPIIGRRYGICNTRGERRAMKTPYIVEPARREDLESCAVMLTALFRLERDFRPGWETQIRGLKMLFSSPSAHIAVAREGEAVIGMATGQLVVSTAEGGHSIWVEDVFVLPGQRRAGVGRALLDEIERWGGGRGATRMQLVADKGNHPARRFYEKQGWEILHLDVHRKDCVPSGKITLPRKRRSAEKLPAGSRL
jgi:GNAT superfamily N-acetyltransferase